MINDDAIAFLESFQARSLLDNLPARFMPCDLVLIALWALAHMLAVDRPNIATADGRRFCLDQDLTVPGLGNLKLFELNRTVSRENRSHHCLIHMI